MSCYRDVFFSRSACWTRLGVDALTCSTTSCLQTKVGNTLTDGAGGVGIIDAMTMSCLLVVERIHDDEHKQEAEIYCLI